jgi:5'-3' exonuclease
MSVKSDVNFRNDIYPIDFGEDGRPREPRWGYKANRWKPKEETNFAVSALRKLAIEHGLAVEAYGRESDDLLRIWSLQCIQFDIPHIISTIDKDLNCLHGLHHHIKSGEKSNISLFESQRFFYEQLLKGDLTDNIPGVPNVGEKRAASYVKHCKTEEELQELVIEQYMNAYGDEWFSWLLSNAKMLYLQKHEHDYFELSSWPMVNYLREFKLDKIDVAPKKSRKKKLEEDFLKQNDKPLIAKEAPKAAFITIPAKPAVSTAQLKESISTVPNTAIAKSINISVKDIKINPKDIKL